MKKLIFFELLNFLLKWYVFMKIGMDVLQRKRFDASQYLLIWFIESRILPASSIANNKFSDSNITSKFFIKNFICLELVRHFEIMMIYLRDPDNTRTCWIYCTVTHWNEQIPLSKFTNNIHLRFTFVLVFHY